MTMTTDTYDFIVVGAGSSGAPLAARLSENGKHSVCIAMFETTCSKLAIFTHHFGKQASGGCVGFREHSLAVKVVCLVTLPCAASLSRQSFLFTISGLIMLAIVR